MNEKSSLATLLSRWDDKIDSGMQVAVRTIRHLLLIIMIVYLLFCLVSLAGNMIQLLLAQGGVLAFSAIKDLLTDSLLVLIILAIVRTLFISRGFDYALAFLEIGFVVLVLGVVSALFFGLIILIYHLKHKWTQAEKIT